MYSYNHWLYVDFLSLFCSTFCIAFLSYVGTVCSATNVSFDRGAKVVLCRRSKHGLERRNTVVNILADINMSK